MDKEISTYLLLGAIFIWIGLGQIGDFIRKYYFDESSDPSNILLGPICIIMSAIEALIIKYRGHKVEKVRKEAQKPLTIYEKRAIERINKLLDKNN